MEAHLGMRFFTQWLMTFVLLTSATAPAQVAPSSPSLASRAQATFGSSDVTFRYLENSTQVIRKDSQGREFILDMPTSSEAELRKFTPSILLKSFKETYQRFPRESFLFFLAIGGVTMFQLATDMAANPVRMQQHVEHTVSPLGMFSFFAFMYANGVSTNYLQDWLKNPRFHAFIPYIGMTAGFFVQSTISTLAADPEVQSCVSQLLGKAPEDGMRSCDGAYARYVLKKQLSLAAPGLISMVASTVMAGLLQKGAVWGVYKLTGVDIALWFVPGGIGVSAIRFTVMSTVQMAAFYYLDAGFLNRKVTFAWRNVIDGASLGRLERRIVDDIASKKTNGWADNYGVTPYLCKLLGRDDCDRNFADALKTFHAEAADWRNLNLLETHEAHQAWQAKLAQLSGEYGVASAFYRDVIEEVRNSRYRLESENVRRLELPAPLAGVTPKKVEGSKDSVEKFALHLYTTPLFLEERASQTAIDVGRWLSSKVGIIPLTDEDLKYFSVIAARLKTGDEKQIRAANQELYVGLRADRDANVVSFRNTLVAIIRRKLRELDPNAKTPRTIAETGKIVGTWLQEQLSSGALVNAEARALPPKDQQFLSDLAEKLKSGVPETQARAITDLNAAIDFDMRGTGFSTRLVFLNTARSMLGTNPTPYFEKGRGFLAAFETYSQSASILNNTSFYKDNGAFQTPRPTDYLVMQMLCGPDVDRGEGTVTSYAGFPATFQAPRLVDEKALLNPLCHGTGDQPVSAMYRVPLRDDKRAYEGVLDYLKANARPSIVGNASETNFQAWWSSKVEAQMSAAYDQYGAQYTDIIAGMLKGLRSTEDSSWNAGPLANSILGSTTQQMRFDLMILGEMLKDLHKAQKDADLPETYFAKTQEPTPVAPRANASNSDVTATGLLASLRRGGLTPLENPNFMASGSILEWNQLIRTYDNPYAKNAGPVTRRALQIQKDVEQEFERLISMINSIKVVPVGVTRQERVRMGRNAWQTIDRKVLESRIVSDLENEDIQKQTMKIGETLKRFATLLGANSELLNKDGQAGNVFAIAGSRDQKDALVKLTTEQNDIAVTALEGLMGLANEISLYGLMANAVNWDKINELKKAKADAAAFESIINGAEVEELATLLQQRDAQGNGAQRNKEE